MECIHLGLKLLFLVLILFLIVPLHVVLKVAILLEQIVVLDLLNIISKEFLEHHSYWEDAVGFQLAMYTESLLSLPRNYTVMFSNFSGL